MYKQVRPGQLILLDHGKLTCKVVGVFENKVTVECLDEYKMKQTVPMVFSGAENQTSLLLQEDIGTIQDFISSHPEIEFVSVP